MNNRVTVVTDRLYPDDNSTSYYMTEITQKISDINDGNIKVICAMDLKNNQELPFLKNKIIRISSSKFNKNKYFSRILRLSTLSLRLGWKTLFVVKKNESLFTYTLDPLILILAIIRKFRKFKYVLLVYDIFPENLIAANLISKKSLIYKLIKNIFDWAYNQADHLVVIGRDMEKLIKKKTNNTVPVSLITNWCDLEKIEIKSKNDNQIIKKYNLENKIVFSFVGNLGRVQGIDFLLEVSSLVKSPEFTMLFIGNGALVDKIKQFIRNNNHNNVIYAGYFPSSENNLILNACDVAIVSLNKSMYGLGVPSRFYNNLAVKKPILYLGDMDTEIGKTILENKIGWVCDNINPSEVAKKIDSIIVEKEKIKDLGNQARNVAETKYSKNYILTKYAKIFS
ncbi:glycosyltransferase family 4 protein [Candidatus Pelagibacter sp.]|nr:glycosyltransferase family 4 protein [Candidatus Pelagibacter sp.]